MTTTIFIACMAVAARIALSSIGLAVAGSKRLAVRTAIGGVVVAIAAGALFIAATVRHDNCVSDYHAGFAEYARVHGQGTAHVVPLDDPNAPQENCGHSLF